MKKITISEWGKPTTAYLTTWKEIKKRGFVPADGNPGATNEGRDCIIYCKRYCTHLPFPGQEENKKPNGRLYITYERMVDIERQEKYNILELVVTAEWYKMIASGKKKEEYREIKPYWEKRLLDYKGLSKYVEENYRDIQARRIFFPSWQPDWCSSFPRNFTHVRFRYGYTGKTMLVECKGINMGIGKREWGAPKDTPVFKIKLGDIILEDKYD